MWLAAFGAPPKVHSLAMLSNSWIWFPPCFLTATQDHLTFTKHVRMSELNPCCCVLSVFLRGNLLCFCQQTCLQVDNKMVICAYKQGAMDNACEQKKRGVSADVDKEIPRCILARTFCSFRVIRLLVCKGACGTPKADFFWPSVRAK